MLFQAVNLNKIKKKKASIKKKSLKKFGLQICDKNKLYLSFIVQ